MTDSAFFTDKMMMRMKKARRRDLQSNAYFKSE
jgi:hypothetical protein